MSNIGSTREEPRISTMSGSSETGSALTNSSMSKHNRTPHRSEEYFNPCCCQIHRGAQLAVFFIIILSLLSATWDVHELIIQVKNPDSLKINQTRFIIFWTFYIIYDAVSIALDVSLYCSVNQSNGVRIWIWLFLMIPLEVIYIGMESYKFYVDQSLNITRLLHFSFWIVVDIYGYVVIYAFVKYLDLRNNNLLRGHHDSNFEANFSHYGSRVFVKLHRGSEESYYGAYPGPISKYVSHGGKHQSHHSHHSHARYSDEEHFGDTH